MQDRRSELWLLIGKWDRLAKHRVVVHVDIRKIRHEKAATRRPLCAIVAEGGSVAAAHGGTVGANLFFAKPRKRSICGVIVIAHDQRGGLIAQGRRGNAIRDNRALFDGALLTRDTGSVTDIKGWSVAV